MKGVTIVLVGLMLMLGLGIARAATGSSVSSSDNVSADHVASPGDVPGGHVELFPANYLASGVNGDNETLASPSVTVMDYVVSPQVTINLECRPFDTEENVADFVSDRVAVKQITQNLMLGFRYKF